MMCRHKIGGNKSSKPNQDKPEPTLFRVHANQSTSQNYTQHNASSTLHCSLFTIRALFLTPYSSLSIVYYIGIHHITTQQTNGSQTKLRTKCANQMCEPKVLYCTVRYDTIRLRCIALPLLLLLLLPQ